MTRIDLAGKRVLVTGGAGFVGRSVCRRLRGRGVTDACLCVARSDEYDLTRDADVARLYADANPQVVVHLAAEVGGIAANVAQPGRFMFANLAMGMHMVEHARRHDVAQFVHVGTVCSYPKHCPVPFREEDLWDGYPEATNAPYGIAKKAIIVLLDGYRRQYGMRSAVVVPVNLYGPGDNFDPATSHVVPALIRKFEAARLAGAEEVVCWGTGDVTREFLHVDDAAEAIVRAAEVVECPDPINLGSGAEITVRELAAKVSAACGYRGRITWDSSKPSGQPRRAVDGGRARRLLDWYPRQDFDAGLEATIRWWRESAGDQAQTTS